MAEAPGKLRNRDDRKVLGSEKEKTVLVPQTKFYNELGQECVSVGCSVDMFLFNNAYIDVATLSQVLRFSNILFQFIFFIKVWETVLTFFFKNPLGLPPDRRAGSQVHLLHPRDGRGAVPSRPRARPLQAHRVRRYHEDQDFHGGEIHCCENQEYEVGIEGLGDFFPGFCLRLILGFRETIKALLRPSQDFFEQ